MSEERWWDADPVAPAAASAEWWKSDPLADTAVAQVGRNVAEFAKGIPGGAVSMVGTAITGAGANLHGFNRGQVEVMDRIDRGEAVPEGDDPIGYQHMGPEDRATARAQYEAAAAQPVKDNPIVKTGQAVSKAGHEMLPAAPGYEDSVGRQLGEGLGSMAAGLAVTVVPGVGQVAGPAMFTMAGSGEAVERAIRDGASEDQIIEAARLGMLPGLTDAAPVEVLLGRVPLPGGQFIKVPAGMLGSALKVAGKIGLQATVEGIQEGGQAFLQNAIAKEVYKPGQDLAEGVLPEAGMGSGVGAIAEAGKLALQSFAGRRGRRAPAGEREKSAAAPAPVTAADEASPIPTDLIAEGRKVLLDAEGVERANTILKRWEAPSVDTRVVVERPDGTAATGILADAYEVNDPDYGLSEAGVKILLDDGTLLERSFEELRREGIRLVPVATADDGSPMALPKPDVTYGDGFVVGAPAAEDMAAVDDQPRALPAPTTVYGDGFRMGGDLGRVSDVMTERQPAPQPPSDAAIDAEFTEVAPAPLALPLPRAENGVHRGDNFTMRAPDPAPLAPLALPPSSTVYGEGFTTAQPSQSPAASGRPFLRLDGSPFATEKSAQLAARSRGDLKGKTTDVVKVPGGFGLMEHRAPGREFRPDTAARAPEEAAAVPQQATATGKANDVPAPADEPAAPPAAAVSPEPDISAQTAAQTPSVATISPKALSKAMGGRWWHLIPMSERTRIADRFGMTADVFARELDRVGYAARPATKESTDAPAAALPETSTVSAAVALAPPVAEPLKARPTAKKPPEAPMPGPAQGERVVSWGMATPGDMVSPGQRLHKRGLTRKEADRLAAATGGSVAEDGKRWAVLRPVVEFAPSEIATIPAQESAKRALEVAAVGGHRVALVGEGEAEIGQLAAAFASIGGDTDKVGASQPDLVIEVYPTSEIDRQLPPPTEKSDDIRARVEKARASLPNVDPKPDFNAEALLKEAERHNMPTDAARRIAPSLAAMDGSTVVRRIHVAEALSYVRQAPVARDGAPADQPAGPALQRGEESEPLPGEVRLARGLMGVPTETYTEHETEIVAAVQRIVERMMPGVRSRVYARMRATEESGQAGEVFGAQWRTREGEEIVNVVAWSLGSPDAERTARHEAIHYIRRVSLLDDQEWGTLRAAAERAGWVERHDIAQRYPELDLDRQLEEAVAEEFAAWRADRFRSLPAGVRRLFLKVDLFLKRVAAKAREILGRDATAADVFTRIETGEVGRRGSRDAGGDGQVAFDRPADMASEAETFSRQLADKIGDDVSSESIIAAGGPLFQRASIVKGTAAQEAVLDRILAPNEADKPIGVRIRERIDEVKANAARALRQGILDQFDALAVNEREVNGQLLDATTSAYKAARLTQNLRSVMHVLLKRGMIDYKGGEFVPVDGFDGGFEAIFAPLAEKGLLRLWQGWAIANRSQRLIQEGREALLSQADIDALLPLAGQHPEFREAQTKWAAFNKAILDMAEHAGVVNPDTRAMWEKDDYVPFFRLLEDEVKGPSTKGGLANQRSGIRALKGGEAAINDLIENMVQNVTHLVDASYKNVAAKRAIRDAKALGVVEAVGMDWQAVRLSPDQLAEALEGIGVQVSGMTPQQHEQWQTFFTMRQPSAPDVVSVLVGGKPKYFKVRDPFLLRALSAMRWNGFDNPIIKLAGGAKRLLTQGITSFPDFMLANAIRDSLSSWVVTGGKTNPVRAARGFVSSLRDTSSRTAIAAAGGGTSGFYDTTPADVRAELQGMLGDGRKGWAHRLWEGWHSIGQATENANRIALYKALREQGVSHAEAAFQAMDLMDFAMRGESQAMRFLIAVVPFLNARVQGLYKLGRAAAEDRAAFALRGAVIASASLALMAANWDDERYEALPDWDKDTYFHLWIGGTHVRVPKPFEVGALFGTIPERMARWVGDKDKTGRFMDRLGTMFLDTFAMNPTPQLIKPMVEQWANKNSFTGGPIVGMGLERLRPGEQVNPQTSAGAELLGRMAPDLVSPVRVDALLRGYLGTLGTSIMAVTNGVEAAVSGKARPDRRIEDVPIVGRYLREDAPARSTRYVEDFYQLRDEVSRVVASARRKQEMGDAVGARELIEENRSKLGLYRMSNRVADRLSDINRLMRQVEADKNLSGAEKRRRLDDLTAERNALAKRAVDAADAR